MPTWNEIVKNNPAHSINYANRWQMLAEQGHDIVGEARLIDAMAQRESRILDAGCGQGRLTGFLTERGHTVVGFDVDPVLIDIAKEANPDATFYVGDLSTDEIPESDFDLIVSAGNVMGFLAPEGRQPALDHLYRALKNGGRAVIAYGSGPGRAWSFPEFFANAETAGFVVEHKFSSWELDPYTDRSEFLVAVLRRPKPYGLGQ
ncbi:class I SAM-dependent methyltransferase [uncultured Corynebacterium sp.]|uniref:class I SAM-dependent DNA methyltransferase n=1 Tax=uncultured Corynebacterium sp. TaxID=159447 RepID=UPI0028F076FE|nr:class I SAM-dependent methyltransferase [uncultured Corynebacterium sp.]